MKTVYIAVTSNGRPVWVNPDHITWLSESPGGDAAIGMAGRDNFTVDQSFEAVALAISSSRGRRTLVYYAYKQPEPEDGQ